MRATKLLPIAEFKTLRMSCTRDGCSGAVEIEIARIDRSGHNLKCPQCGETTIRDGQSSDDPFSRFARALTDLQKAEKANTILLEIVLENEI